MVLAESLIAQILEDVAAHYELFIIGEVGRFQDWRLPKLGLVDRLLVEVNVCDRTLLRPA